MHLEGLSCEANLSSIISKLPPANSLLIAQFLDDLTIQKVVKVTQNHDRSLGCVVFFDIILVKNFVLKYLNYTDRSAYFYFYCEDKFKGIQNTYVQNLCLKSYFGFKKVKNTIERVQQQIHSTLHFLIDTESFLKYFLQSIRDPLPPEMGLRKTSIGMYCNSGFQFHMVEKRFPSYQDKYIESPFVELIEGLTAMKNSQIQQGSINDIFSDKNSYQKISYFFNYWYKVNTQNYEQYLITDRRCYVSVVHNTLVQVIVLFEAIIQSVDLYLEALSEDLIHQFVQFNLRFSLFRNTLLEVQGQLSFMFQIYNQIQQQVKTQDQNPVFRKMSLWHCLLSKWYLYMKKRHDTFSIVYCSLLKKMNFKQFCSALQQKHIQSEQYMISLQNNLDSQEDQVVGGIVVQIQSQLTEIIQENQIVGQLLRQFAEYLVDISINEDSVHWCGHSDHLMHIPYENHEQIVIQSMKKYFQSIYMICYKIDPTKGLFMQVTSKIFIQLDRQYLKPVTLKKVLQLVNHNWVNSQMIEENCIQIGEKSRCTALDCIDFSERDRRLQHFNGHANIPQKFDYSHNIVIQAEEFNLLLKISNSSNSTLDSCHHSSSLQESKFFENNMKKTFSCDIQI